MSDLKFREKAFARTIIQEVIDDKRHGGWKICFGVLRPVNLVGQDLVGLTWAKHGWRWCEHLGVFQEKPACLFDCAELSLPLRQTKTGKRRSTESWSTTINLATMASRLLVVDLF